MGVDAVFDTNHVLDAALRLRRILNKKILQTITPKKRGRGKII